jgi:hypothetical protein
MEEKAGGPRWPSGGMLFQKRSRAARPLLELHENSSGSQTIKDHSARMGTSKQNLL